MQKEISPALIIGALVILVGLIIGAIVYFTQPRPPAGVSYTPGVPPWADKAKGQTGAPGSGYNPRAPMPGAR